MSAPTPDPRGRLDLALLRMLEMGARKVEMIVGASIWDGEDGLNEVMKDKIRELKIPTAPIHMGETFSVRSIAEQAGFIKRRRRKAVK